MQRKADPAPIQLSADEPEIWVLLGHRAGDNAQARAFAKAIGSKVIEKQLHYNFLHHLPNVLLGPTIATLNLEARALLRPPWPRLVVAVGKRSASVARWIKRQSLGQTQLVHLGRPRAPLNAFDLVITTPQYKLPELKNVLQVSLPFTEPVPDLSDFAQWAQTWKQLPRPWLMAIIGGEKHPLILTAKEGRDFGQRIDRAAASAKGSILLFGSPRSDQAVIDNAASEIKQPLWIDGRTRDGQGAYSAGLALADKFAVTSDSVSMLADIVSTGRPACVYVLPVSRWKLRWGKSSIGRWLARSGMLQPPRDTMALVRELIDNGIVSELGKERIDPGGDALLKALHQEAIRRARDLLMPGNGL
jgi:uncharacterized protein